VSRDGRDLVVLSEECRVFFIHDFERICRGEITFEQAALVLEFQSEPARCFLSFEHGRVCVANIHWLYIFTFGPDLSVKTVFVRPSKNTSAWSFSNCAQLTDRRLYFTWGDSTRRQDIPLFKDAEDAQEVPLPTTSYSDVLEDEEPAILGQGFWERGGYPFIKSVSSSADSDIPFVARPV